MTDFCRVRPATAQDITAIAQIYAWHVLHGIATFEEIVPDREQMLERFVHITTQGYPYIVAEKDGEIIGYAYASSFRPRVAYRYTVENAIYLRHDLGRMGAGSQLLAELIRLCEAGPWRQMIAVIGNSANAASIAVHRKAGFEMIGTLAATGFKHGQWVDTVLMQRALSGGAQTLPDTADTATSSPAA
ncbi:phosphinothricin acetyltransferase [Advenella incenata]|jgi:phosphinothricin acetyltransferase|uniref:Phosphinothricin acetyltransferase n=1 Tax=Advenella incenata TaxID=267800 RepID=A0A4Q7VT81_9BURK|nr:GNAT family N-acetyltransferase [Advenella incenata]RZT99517.1 phosphinothricin acetyltransferase [Advenella incenata]